MEDNVENVENLEVVDPIGATETKETAFEDGEVSKAENEEKSEEISEDNTEDKSEESTEETKSETKSKTEDDTKFAIARRKAEKEYKAKLDDEVQKAYEKGQKEAEVKLFVGKVNPYTNEPIQDEFDVEEYKQMLEIESAGGDPLKDYTVKVKDKARKEAKVQLEQETQKQQEEKNKQDIADFVEKYPTVDLSKMFKEPKFAKFINGKVGNQPLIEIYEDYKYILGEFEQEKTETVKKVIAKSNSTPGSLSNGQSKDFNYSNMSDEEFEKQVQKALKGG